MAKETHRLLTTSPCIILSSSSIRLVVRCPPGRSSAEAFIPSSVLNSSLACPISSAFPQSASKEISGLTVPTTAFPASSPSIPLSDPANPAKVANNPSTSGKSEVKDVGVSGEVHPSAIPEPGWESEWGCLPLGRE